jgi:hypothetical protein
MTQVCAHIGVSAECAGRLADGLQQPDYYTPRFTDEERAAIAQETSVVAGRLGY